MIQTEFVEVKFLEKYQLTIRYNNFAITYTRLIYNDNSLMDGTGTYSFMEELKDLSQAYYNNTDYTFRLGANSNLQTTNGRIYIISKLGDDSINLTVNSQDCEQLLHNLNKLYGDMVEHYNRCLLIFLQE